MSRWEESIGRYRKSNGSSTGRMNTDFLPFKVEAYPETESPYFLPARMTHGQNRPSLASGRDALRRGKIGQATGALASPTGERSPIFPQLLACAARFPGFKADSRPSWPAIIPGFAGMEKGWLT